MEPSSMPPEKNKRREEVGEIVGIVIVVLLLLCAGIYVVITEKARLHNAPVQEQVNS